MNEIQIFNNPDFGEIRTVVIGGEPWFVGKDVAAALGYARPTDAARNNTDNDDKGVSEIATPSGTQKMLVINESGLYSLIFGSKLDSAKKFKKWVTSEVLPSIRKHGTYQLPQSTDGKIALLAQGHTELKAEVDEIKAEVKALKDDMPVFQADAKDIQSDLRKKAVESLGGYKSPAYSDKSTRTYVFADIQRELKRQFDVKRYDQIKHKDTPIALEIIAQYKLPLALKNRVDMANAQQSFDLEGGVR